MTRKRDEDIKILIKEVGLLFDARAKILEINIKAHTDAAIKASEERIKTELRAELASKEDIKDMATKQDIKDMVRKQDIKDMVRKQDIKDMVRKQDIKDMVRKQDIKDMVRKQDIARLETKIDETTKLQKQIDELRRKLDQVEIEFVNVKSKN
jgi:hypothetical protein